MSAAVRRRVRQRADGRCEYGRMRREHERNRFASSVPPDAGQVDKFNLICRYHRGDETDEQPADATEAGRFTVGGPAESIPRRPEYGMML